MNNFEKYVNAFVENFDVEAAKVSELEYQSVPQWDSIGHMNLIASLEDTFGIMLEMDDIIDFSSFAKGVEILKKYDVLLEQ